MARGNKNSNVKAMLKDVVRTYNSNALNEEYFDRRQKLRRKCNKPFKKFNDE